MRKELPVQAISVNDNLALWIILSVQIGICASKGPLSYNWKEEEQPKAV